MIQLKTKKSELIEGYHEATLVVDTGSSVVSIDFGIVHADDIEAIASEMSEAASKTLVKIGVVPAGF